MLHAHADRLRGGRDLLRQRGRLLQGDHRRDRDLCRRGVRGNRGAEVLHRPRALRGDDRPVQVQDREEEGPQEHHLRPRLQGPRTDQKQDLQGVGRTVAAQEGPAGLHGNLREHRARGLPVPRRIRRSDLGAVIVAVVVADATRRHGHRERGRLRHRSIVVRSDCFNHFASSLCCHFHCLSECMIQTALSSACHSTKLLSCNDC
mmetsp:Transcript_21493/g.51273  ORF Transcript_21493/g.51273 Transcript_21493/m.51273 type:complete len:204 (-) Transcript_21493:102-713(-)